MPKTRQQKHAIPYIRFFCFGQSFSKESGWLQLHSLLFQLSVSRSQACWARRLQHLARPRRNSEAKTVTSKRLIKNQSFRRDVKFSARSRADCAGGRQSHCSSSGRPAHGGTSNEFRHASKHGGSHVSCRTFDAPAATSLHCDFISRRSRGLLRVAWTRWTPCMYRCLLQHV